MKKLLVFMLLSISLTTFCQIDTIDSKVVRKIKMINLPTNAYNIDFETKDYFFYFSKTDVLKFCKINDFWRQENLKQFGKELELSKTNLHFQDVFWKLKFYENPNLFKKNWEKIKSDKYLNNSYLFEQIMKYYLKTGNFKIFSKKVKSFLKVDKINFVTTNKYNNRGSSYSIDKKEYYQLLNGVILFNGNFTATLGDRFNIPTKKKNENEKRQN